MTTVPEVRYARSGDVAIAYQVVGDGPTDLVFVPFLGNIRWAWEQPIFARFLERLASFSRLILFDKRGTGLSDRPRTLTLETQMDDIRAVLDAVGSERAALLGALQGGQLCALFAATYPERVAALVLYHPHAAPSDLPPIVALSPDDSARALGVQRARRPDDRLHRSVARGGRVSAGLVRRSVPVRGKPGSGGRVLPHARRHGHQRRTAHDPRAHARPASRAVARERRVVSPRSCPARPPSRYPGAIRRSGSAPRSRQRSNASCGTAGVAVPDSVLTTILFTDIVGSTEHAVALGDRSWRDLLERHHAVVGVSWHASAGKSVDTAGDGFFATFDGPARAIRCAQAIVDEVGQLGLAFRAGLHTGECELHGGKLAGIAVSIGARVAGAAGTGQVVRLGDGQGPRRWLRASSSTSSACALSREPGEWRLYAVRG